MHAGHQTRQENRGGVVVHGNSESPSGVQGIEGSGVVHDAAQAREDLGQVILQGRDPVRRDDATP